MSCATELLHPANFCPVCGARLAAPVPDGSAATLPGGETPTVVAVPEQPAENVVYLPSDHVIGPAAGGTVPPNREAHRYDGVPPQEAADQPEPAGPSPLPVPGSPPPTVLHPPTPVDDELRRQQAAEVAAALPAFGSHGPLPQQHELVPPPTVGDNPFGDFFSDGPSAWLEDDPDEVRIEQPRVVGTMLAAGAVAMLCAGWAVWGAAMYRGSGGAEAGGFVLLAMLLWIWYLSMPREQQHAFMLRRHARVQGLVDRRTAPLRERTEGQLTMRRERERYRAMRDERTRRVNALGEGAYRAFRQGQLPTDLHPGAQRVLGMERQMLAQDQRIAAMEAERRAGRDVAFDDD